MIAPYFDPTEMMSNIACLRGIVAMAKERKERGISIAAALNCHYDGIQSGFWHLPDTMQFTDNVTGSTTYGNSVEEVREAFVTYSQRVPKVLYSRLSGQAGVKERLNLYSAKSNYFWTFLVMLRLFNGWRVAV